MKGLFFGFLILISFNVFALDGTTNPPDESSSSDTPIMGGGTPGNMNVEKVKRPQKQEESEKQKDKKIDKKDITDQNKSLDTL